MTLHEKCLLGGVVVSLVFHELGHYLTAKKLGVKTYGFRVGFRGFGLARDFGTQMQNLSITLAGPTASLLLSGLAILLAYAGDLWLTRVGVQLSDFTLLCIVYTSIISFLFGAYNLLPLPFSDGKRVRALLKESAQAITL